jgi:CTP:molybdopterin cytidylyltransferase MocA
MRSVGPLLAAGAGRRLGPQTTELPKTLLGVDGDRTILDVALTRQAAALDSYALRKAPEPVARCASGWATRPGTVVGSRVPAVGPLS